MPYIITTRPHDTNAYRQLKRTTRRAVATLDEARDYAWEQAGWKAGEGDVPGGIHDVRRSHDGFNVHTGGTIGPLPDGTVIEVQHLEGEAGWITLANRALLNDERRHDNDAILDAFNAA